MSLIKITEISRLFYTDVIEVYAKNKEQSQVMLVLVNSFTNGMKLRLVVHKCTVIKVENDGPNYYTMFDKSTHLQIIRILAGTVQHRDV